MIFVWPRFSSWDALEAVSVRLRLVTGQHLVVDSLPRGPVRSDRRADHPRDSAASSVRRNPPWAVPRTSATFGRRPASLDTSAAVDNRLDIASSGCRTCPMERFRSRRRCREDVFGILRRSPANRRTWLSRCTKVHRCTVARWRFRSSRSNTWCKMSRGRKYHKASRNGRLESVDWLDVFHRNSSLSRGSRSPRLHRDVCQRKQDRLDSRTTLDVHSHTPNNDRSTLCHPRPSILFGRGLLAAASGRTILETKRSRFVAPCMHRVCTSCY